MEHSKSLKKRKEYFCNICDFKSFNSSDYTRHLSTRKHKVSVAGTQEQENEQKKTEKSQKFICECICGNKYTSYSGRWKHRLKCQEYINNEEIEIEMHNAADIQPKQIDIICSNSSSTDLKELTGLVMTLVQQNKDLTQQIIDLSNKPSNINNGTINNNTTNNSNNKFNLNVFLNEECKDAMNMTEFIESLQISIDDLEATGQLGYASGISRIFINGLKSLDIHNRPIHCSDLKREVLYIKDNNIWFKESDEKEHITVTIKQIAHKNMIQINEWQKLHPEFNNPESKQNDKYQKIIYNSMPGITKEETTNNYCKIIRNLAKEVVIEK